MDKVHKYVVTYEGEELEIPEQVLYDIKANKVRDNLRKMYEKAEPLMLSKIAQILDLISSNKIGLRKSRYNDPVNVHKYILNLSNEEIIKALQHRIYCDDGI